MKQYTFNKNALSEGVSKLTVYSLSESDSVAVYIQEFKRKHPEIEVTYEVGLDADDSAITAEDALKKLNTRLLAKKDLMLFLWMEFLVTGKIIKDKDSANRYFYETTVIAQLLKYLKVDDDVYIGLGEVEENSHKYAIEKVKQKTMSSGMYTVVIYLLGEEISSSDTVRLWQE